MREMKNSGIEWIGDIPSGWKVCKLKNIIKFLNGYAFDSGVLKSDGLYPVIRIGDKFHTKYVRFSLVITFKKRCKRKNLHLFLLSLRLYIRHIYICYKSAIIAGELCYAVIFSCNGFNTSYAVAVILFILL